MIKTWQQRCEEHPDHEGIVTEQMIRDRMQEEIDELRQALDDKPAVKSYCGGKPNYTTPVDAVNMTQESVDETAKGEHEPVEKNMTLACPAYLHGYTASPKREWVGLTDEEITKIGNLDWDSAYVGIWYDFARAIEAKLKEKNT
jgi:hypothetical protein